MNSLQLITLDLDNTLWDVEKTIRAAEQELVQWLAQHASAAHKIYSSSDMLELRNQTLQQHADLRHDLSRLRIEILFNVMRAAQYPAAEARELAEAAFEVFFRRAQSGRILSPCAGNAANPECALSHLCINQRQR